MQRMLAASNLALLVLLSMGCAGSRQPSPPPPNANRGDKDMSGMKLTSTAFKEGEPIPRAYTCDGPNVSPALEWSGVPKSAKTLAIICDDPDAPSGTWVHWVLYNLPAENIGLVENTPATESLRAGGFQGKNDFEKIGYGGPCPPSGTHRYNFKIFALDRDLDLVAGSKRAQLDAAMKGHILAQGQLMGRYSKQK